MPYIAAIERKKYKEIIEKSINLLQNAPAGELNYFISSIVWKIFDRNTTYTKANELIGCLEAAKQEFIRRKLNILEDRKIFENGDINLF